MFGIGLPEILIILAVALIVVGPDKLPELARSLAKGIMELKKTANSLRDNIQEEIKGVESEVKPWESLPPELPPAPGLPETTAEESQPEAEASIEEQKERVILPEDERREHRPGMEANGREGRLP
jgi:sec-independent protein translocase protein TatB